MAIILFFVGAVFLLLGYLIGVKRMSGLIAGVNTASKEQKEKLDLPALTRAVGVGLSAIGVLSVLAGALSLARIPYAIEAWMLLFFLSIWFLVIFVQKYDRSMVDDSGKPTRRFYVFFAAISLVMMAMLAFIGLSALSTVRDPEVSFAAESMTIGGMYATRVNRGEILSVSLLYDLPELEGKTNGSGIFGVYKGNYRVAGYGLALVYVRMDSIPWILVKRESKPMLLCLSASGDTLALYERLEAFLKGE